MVAGTTARWTTRPTDACTTPISVVAVATGQAELLTSFKSRWVGRGSPCADGGWDNGALDDTPDGRLHHTDLGRGGGDRSSRAADVVQEPLGWPRLTVRRWWLGQRRAGRHARRTPAPHRSRSWRWRPVKPSC